MKYILKWICMVCLSVGTTSVSVYALTTDHDAADLQDKLSSIRTFSASFDQKIRAKKRHISTSSGQMALSRPGLFRWQTNQPMAQLVVADGRHVWIYDKELEQVSVKKQTKSIGGVAALFLSEEPALLTRDFKVTKALQSSRSVFTLLARSSKSSFEKIELIFDAQTLTQMTLFDQLGQQTEIHLSHVKQNPKLAAKLFHFTVPKGVDVVQQ